MTRFSTLRELLDSGDDGATALAAPGAEPLTYGTLRSIAGRCAERLNAAGLERGARVAIVMPNGPEMAAAFIAIASSAVAAPLNPAYTADEFDFYLGDLNSKALVVERGSRSPAIEAARRRGVKVIELVSVAGGAGAFDLLPPDGRSAGSGAAGETEGGDVALILHTSGTTSRPKIVPLTQANICASACNVRDTVALTASDRGLNIMPLFHIHGLIAGLLAPLAAGGSVFCSAGFNALKFFALMKEAKPTWYTAVPTMHQAILSRASHNSEVIAATRLRFIRSSSSSIPPQVIRELENVFGAPLIESYGMTEAAHQMTSNPLPPHERKPGSVGKSAGPEVAVMDEHGTLLPSNVTGEVVIRGRNVTAGYENNSKANAEAFTRGWFRTGDQGMLDDEGYLTITGRLKEIINRGGEKVSPREVDEVLMDHPAVQQVVTFAIPHDKLFEDIGAAVVLRNGQSASEKELRDFASKRLAEFKVPRKILFIDEIPKGATGKLQRIGLAAKLGLA